MDTKRISMVWPADLKDKVQETAGQGSLTEFTIEAVEAHLKDHTVIRDAQRELDETKLLCQLLADRIVMGGTSTDRLEALMEVEFPSWMDTSGWPSEFAKRVPAPEPGGRPDWVKSGEEKPSISGKMDEVDRNARAYGYEVGKGAEPADVIETTPDNPFIPAESIVAPEPTPEIIAEAQAIAAEHGIEPVEPVEYDPTPAEPTEQWKPKDDGKDDLFARIAAKSGADLSEVLGKVKPASEIVAPEPKPVEELSPKEAKYASQDAPEPADEPEVEALKPGLDINFTAESEVVPAGVCPKCKQELIDGECWTCG